MAVLSILKDPASPAGIALRSFTTQWFLLPQGSGIIAVILHQLDYQFDGLIIISEIFWVYTVFLLALFLLIYFLRIIIFPKEVAHALRTNINETACLASISITFTSIIQMTALNLVHEWGLGWGTANYVLWWVNAAMAIICNIVIPYVFVQHQPPGIDGLSPATNLPLIAALTAAAGGGVICRYGGLTDREQVPVIILSYILIGMAFPLALAFSTVFLARLFNGNSPLGVKIYQDMILCGPWGQGSFAMQILGTCVMRGSFAGYSKGIFLTNDAAKSVGYASIFAGLIAWGQGTFWWAFSIVRILHSGFDIRGHWEGLKFGMAAWSLVFPWGVYTNACVELGNLLDAPAFKGWSTALAAMLVILWIVITILTIRGVFTGQLLGLKHGWRKESYKHDRAGNSVNGIAGSVGLPVVDRPAEARSRHS